MDISRSLLLLAFGLVVVPVSPASAACDVTVAGGSFEPASKTVTPGTTVTWCWTGDNHSVTADGGAFDSHPTCPPTCGNNGHTFAHTFGQTGTFAYHCRIHGSMTATIAVQQPSPTTTPSKSPTARPTTASPRPVATTARPTTAAAATPTRTPTAAPTTAAPTTAAPTTAAPSTTAVASPTTSPAALDIDPAPAKPKTGLAIVTGLVVAAAAFGTAGWLLLRGRSG